MLPTYNEAENVGEVLRLIRKALPAADVLVVDDASPDGTAEVAAGVGAEASAALLREFFAARRGRPVP